MTQSPSGVLTVWPLHSTACATALPTSSPCLKSRSANTPMPLLIESGVQPACCSLIPLGTLADTFQSGWEFSSIGFWHGHLSERTVGVDDPELPEAAPSVLFLMALTDLFRSFTSLARAFIAPTTIASSSSSPSSWSL